MQSEKNGPNFLCVGMPKCGTSTLHSVLRTYSDIYVSPFKELKFFASGKIGYEGGVLTLLFSRHWAARQERRDIVRLIRKVLKREESAKELGWAAKFILLRRNLDWYRSLFPEDRISGDISPAYHMLGEREISEIATLFPDLRIVILLRNPYHQIWSHCRMSARGKSPADEVAFFRDQVDYQLGLSASYRDLVTRWSNGFGSENVLVDYLENMQAETAAVARRVVTFVDPNAVTANQLQELNSDYRVFAGKKLQMAPGVHALLMDAARARLEGFETVNRTWADRWRQELEEIDALQTGPG